MLSFAVFFADEAAACVTRVDAPDAATAEALVMEEHPGAKVHAVDGATVTEENRVRLLAAWLEGERSELGGAAARPQSVQHPDPDPPQQSHRHHRQSKHSKALKLF